MSKALATKNVAAVLLGLALVFGFAFAFAAPAKADTLSDLQAQIQSLLAQIAALQGNSGACFTFTQNLTIGSTGAEVLQAQKFLNAHGAVLAATGAGSPGNETSYFGARTRAAVSVFQAANGITPTAGYWGPITRAKANSMCTTPVPPGPVPPGPVVPGTLMISAGTQPANSLAPKGAARVPFTTFVLTNSSNVAVTINGITVQRVGLAQDAAFSGVVLIDSNNIQIGTSKTFNSNHQAVVGDTFTIQPGTSMTLTVAGNMASSLTSYTGQVAGISVVGVNTTAVVSGALPITGAMQTLNDTLTIGTVSTSTSAFDPGVATSKNIGDTGIKFSGVKFTAGSGEDLKLYSIRWRQVGSVSSSDLANVVTIVNGTSYPALIDASGKYYTTVFPGGILIGKGNSIDVYVQGDIVGSNASSRNADFDIDKVTDVYFVGQLYGYGIAPSGTYTPWYDGYVVSITGASVTTIGKDTGAANAAQNIAANISNQPLGGYVVDLKGEPISVQSHVFTIATGTASVGLLTNVSIVNENGSVIAGPVDAVYVANTTSGAQKVTFTDTVTYPLGRHVYSLKGKIPSGAGNSATIAVSTTPSSNWTSVTGQTTGNSVSLSGNGAFTMNTMTVKAGALAVAISSTPASTTIVTGSQGFIFANIQLDATQSGEDVRLNSFGLSKDNDNNALEGAANKLSSCQVWDGATALNGGSNTVNPTNTATTTSPTAHTFTLDSSLTVPKGTVKTLALKCNLSSSADTSSTFQWGITSTQIGNIAATGVSSGSTIVPTGSTNSGQRMAVASTGTLVATTDSASPSYKIAAAGSTGVTLGSYRLTTTNEAVSVNQIGLQLSGATASSTAADLTQVYLYNGTTLIGTASFVGSNRNATSTLSSALIVPKDGFVTVTVKGDLADQNASAASAPGALLTVNIDTNGTNTQGIGVQSSATVNSTGTTAVSGVRVFKSYPTVTQQTSGMSSTLVAQAGIDLYRFSITANASGDVTLNRFVLNVATSSFSTTVGSTTVTNVLVKAYTDSAFSNTVSGFTDGQVVPTIAGVAFAGAATSTFSGTLTIPAGATYYFKVIGDVAQTGGTGPKGTVTTKLIGDAAYSAGITTLMSTFATTLGNFVWSPVSTTTATTSNFDWTNGFSVPGLPSGGTNSFTLSN